MAGLDLLQTSSPPAVDAAQTLAAERPALCWHAGGLNNNGRLCGACSEAATLENVTLKMLHAGPAVGFEAPFEMLLACHERVLRTLDLLLRLQAHLAAHGADAPARDAARDVLRYFDLAAPQHHLDEERHLLPRLRALGQDALAEQVAAEHREMAARYAALRPGLVALAEQGVPPVSTADWPAYVALYRQHVVLEESQVYPPASAGLAADELAAMGREMAARRRP